MLLNVINAEYINDYKIKVFFDNGLSKIVDLKNTIFNDNRKIFEPLRNIDFFKNFSIKLNTITWENELDLAPEYLFDL
ncbi:MAG TPA: DUF2442 domain-containing protein [Candidatus Kapabacteria bacterium]|nr:DUF2442 domain-containing protein [Candidatus Kapabacteria bacterium]HPO62721.1 DUF2442 domain-containing protein [Candidatus Kapabacteria bacterium]